MLSNTNAVVAPQAVNYYTHQAQMINTEQAVPEAKPLISREGMRQSHKTVPAYRGSKRTKKNPEQVAYLSDLYERLGGKWDGKVRKDAMAKTGLSRIQIYKWFFDRQLQDK